MDEALVLGVTSGLGSAVAWGIGSIAIKTQAGKLSALSLNGIRSLFGTAFFLAAVVLLNRRAEFLAFDVLSLVALTLTVLLGFIGSDTLFLQSMRFVELSRSFPIVASYPILTVLLAWLLLGESLTMGKLAGTVIVVLGVSLLGPGDGSQPNNYAIESPSKRKKGILLAVVSSLFWGVAAVVLRVGVRDSDPVAASALLAWGNTVVLLLLPVSWSRGLSLARSNFRFLGALAVAGFVGGPGLAALLYVVAVDNVGAGLASVLTSTAPLYTAVMAVTFLRETVTLRVGSGTVLTVLGVALAVGGH